MGMLAHGVSKKDDASHLTFGDARRNLGVPPFRSRRHSFHLNALLCQPCPGGLGGDDGNLAEELLPALRKGHELVLLAIATRAMDFYAHWTNTPKLRILGCVRAIGG